MVTFFPTIVILSFVVGTVTSSPFLETNGVCWTHDHGEFCMKDGRFQSVTWNDNGKFFDEYHNGKKYSYMMEDSKDILRKMKETRSEMDKEDIYGRFGRSNAELDEVFNEYVRKSKSRDSEKYNCHVEESESVVGLLKTKQMKKSKGKGTNLWRVGRWKVRTDKNNIPISIKFHKNTNNIKVNSVRKFHESIVGCMVHGGDTDRDTEEDVIESDSRGGRFLSQIFNKAIAELENSTNWGVFGNDIANTQCPTPESDDTSYDYRADRAFRRHDQAVFVDPKTIQGVSIGRADCLVDKQLYSAGGDSWAVKALYGEWGVSGFYWGCKKYTQYWCWSGWSFLPTCEGSVTKYGPFRYFNSEFYLGYEDKINDCSDDLPFNATATISLDKSSYIGAEPKLVTFANDNTNFFDWIGIYECETDVLEDWKWTWFKSSGTKTFISPILPGCYYASLFSGKGQYELAYTSNFTVVADPNTFVVTDKLSYLVGETVFVRFQTSFPTDYDWIAIFACVTFDYIDWDYTGGEASGTLEFTDLSAGCYIASLYNGKDDEIAFSSEFNVISGPEPSGNPSLSSKPSETPSETPSRTPSGKPSEKPTETLSEAPSLKPSGKPSGKPSFDQN